MGDLARVSDADESPASATPTPVPAPLRFNDGTHTIRVVHQLSEVHAVRAELVTDLRRRGVASELIDECESVIAELFTNAVKHAAPLPDGRIRLFWKVRSGVVEIEVRDGGSEREPRPRRPSQWATQGRGLRIVRSFAHEWGIQPERNGKTVWASMGGPSRRRTR